MITVRRASFAATIVAAVACGGAVEDSNIPLDGSTTSNDGQPQQGDATSVGDATQQADTSTGVQPIPCGMGPSCDPSTQVCCGTQQGASCTPIGQCKGISFSCTSSANCSNGDVCCGSAMGMSIQAKCAPMCGAQQAQLCLNDNECKQPGYTCRSVPQLQGLKVCAPPQPDGGFPPPKDAGGPG